MSSQGISESGLQIHGPGIPEHSNDPKLYASFYTTPFVRNGLSVSCTVTSSMLRASDYLGSSSRTFPHGILCSVLISDVDYYTGSAPYALPVGTIIPESNILWVKPAPLGTDGQVCSPPSEYSGSSAISYNPSLYPDTVEHGVWRWNDNVYQLSGSKTFTANNIRNTAYFYILLRTSCNCHHSGDLQQQVWEDRWYIVTRLDVSGYIPAVYDITYKKNTSDTVTNLPATGYKTEDVTYTISSTIPVRDGYTFSKWNTQADGEGTDYASGASYTTNANLTLYAIWTAAGQIYQMQSDGTWKKVNKVYIYDGTQWVSTDKVYRYNGTQWVKIT